MALQISIDDAVPHDVVLTRRENESTVWIDGRRHRAHMRPAGGGFVVSCDDRESPVWFVVDGDFVYIHAFGRAYKAEVMDPVERSLRGTEQADVVTAPMPGTIITLAVAAGDPVAAGQPLVVIESMKMQSEIVAWRDGVVERVHIEVGDNFDRGARLVALVPSEVA